MSDPKPQLLLTRRPIICSRCMHGHQVEVITGREKTPVEYHCGCGNYAIVGMPAKWPFMEVVKEPVNNSVKYSSDVKPANNISQNYSSPMQVGENIIQEKLKSKMLEPQKKAPTSKLPECKVEGCTMRAGIRGVCAYHFHKEYGISYDTYLRNRKGPYEDPKAVAARWTDRRVKSKLTVKKITKEEKTMPKPTCSREGCREPSEAAYLCKGCFKDQYGITVEEYRTNKRHRTDSVSAVAARVKGEEKTMPMKEGNPNLDVGAVRPAPPPPPPKSAPLRVEAKQAEPDPIPLFQIFLDPELLEKLAAAAKKEYRTPELHAAWILDKELSA